MPRSLTQRISNQKPSMIPQHPKPRWKIPRHSMLPPDIAEDTDTKEDPQLWWPHGFFSSLLLKEKNDNERWSVSKTQEVCC